MSERFKVHFAQGWCYEDELNRKIGGGITVLRPYTPRVVWFVVAASVVALVGVAFLI